MSKKENDKISKYLRYAKDAEGVPDDFDDWASDNGIKTNPKNRKAKREDYDDSE